MMMHINLIRAKRARRRDAGERALVIMGAAVLAAVALMVVVTTRAGSELQTLVRANNVLKDDIERLKSELGDYDVIKQQRLDLLKQQKTIDALKEGRTGPVYLMRELSEILTAGEGPDLRSAELRGAPAPRSQRRLQRRLGSPAGLAGELRRDPEQGAHPCLGADQRGRGGVPEAAAALRLLRRCHPRVHHPGAGGDAASNGGAKHVTFNLSARVVY